MKKKLWLLTLVLLIIAAGNIIFVSTSALQPSERAKAQRSFYFIGDLETGDYRFEAFDRKTKWNDIVLVLRDWDGVIYAYLVPTNNGRIPMPDRFWGWGWYDCEDFRPELDLNGKIKKDGVVKCHDNNPNINSWEWSYNGSPRYKWLPVMYAPPVEIVGDKLFINR